MVGTRCEAGWEFDAPGSKEFVSSESCFDERVEARRQFEALAATNKDAQAILDMEAAILEQSRPVAEPRVIPCRSLLGGPGLE